MRHASRELIEEYALEIICRAQSTTEKCNQLLAADFASTAPIMLASTMCRMGAFLEAAVKSKVQSAASIWDPLDVEKADTTAAHLQIIDDIIRLLGGHVQFIDAARTPSVPWSVVRPFEKLARKLIPGITVMLLPQWDYNYSIITADLCAAYRKLLEEIGDRVGTSASLDQVFEKFPQPFHLVFFPALEKKNILLHSLLGHELGHLLSEKYINDNEGVFLKNNRDKIVNYVETKSGKIEPLFRQQIIKHGLERTVRIWKRGVAETLADVVGAILFGPAMLLAAVESSVQGELDHIPSEQNNFYPPWRFRIREIYRSLEAVERFFPLTGEAFGQRISEAVNKRVELVRTIVDSNEDEKAISRPDDMGIAYTEIVKDVETARQQFLKTWEQSGLVIRPGKLYGRLRDLINRLDHGIPPNAYEKSLDEREPANIVDIINAAWFHKIAWEDSIFDAKGNFNEEMADKREVMNILTLKAIEYSDLERQYREKVQTAKSGE